MNELSIEEKVRRYDEILKVANKYKDIHIMFSSIQDEMFPELTESEDEKIRKRLISYFKSQMEAYKDSNPDVLYTYKQWISWLEKKEEQKEEALCNKCEKAHPSHYCQDITELKRCTVEHEQKPTEVEPKFKVGDVIHKIGENTIYPIKIERITDNNDSYVGNNERVFITIKFQDDYELVERNSWSKDAKKRINQICEDLKCGMINFCAGKNVKGIHFEEIIESNIAWLKELAERIDLQLSEEDEKMVENIIDTINTAISDCDVDDIGTKARFSLEKERDWLRNKLNFIKH